MKDCMFQYATKYGILANTGLITRYEACQLFDKNKSDFVDRLESDEEPEMCIWVNCMDDTHYTETSDHWHFSEMRVIDGDLYQLTQVEV